MQMECLPQAVAPAAVSNPAIHRMIGVALAGPSLAMLLIACWLQPRASGYGTHEQLHLPACGTLATTGWPCPSCGLTTSVSQSVRGNVVAAWHANPFGIALTAVAVTLVALGSWQAATGRRILAKLGPWPVWAAGTLAGMLLGWGWNIYSHLQGRWPAQ